MRRATASIGLALVALAYLTGCGSGPPTTRFLLVSDSLNNRVLFYGYPLNTNESANGVLGQAGFTTSGPALTAATFNGPLNTAEDSAGNIYVSDFNNLRVLQFKPPFSNGMSASLVIGQPDFVTANPNTTQNGLGGPSGAGGPGGLAFDGNANLWVVDLVTIA